MKDSRNIAIRSLTLLFLLASSTSLTGCSTVSSVAGGVYDTVMWAPRKIDDLFTVQKNNNDTALGPRRRPTENPQNTGMPPMPMSQMQQAPQSMDQTMPMPLMPQAQSTSPQMGGYPQQGIAPQGGTPQATGYPSVNPYGNMGGIQQAPSGGMNGVYPSMPQMPPNGQPMSNLQPPDTMDGSDGESAESAFAKGGGGGSSQNQSKGWSLPFIGKYKMEQTFEPLSTEFVVAENELQNESPETLPAIKPSHKASMFPLAQYAPKEDVSVQKIESPKKPYPKLGRIPENPNITDSEKAAAELDNMVKEADDIETRKAEIHNLPAPENQAPAVSPKDVPLKAPEVKELRPEGINTQQNLPDNPVVPATTQQLSRQENRYPSVATGEALKHDADVISKLPKTEDTKQKVADKNEQKPGFFTRLFGKSTPSRKITRKSQPPVQNTNVEETVFEQTLPSVNIPDNINRQDASRPLPEAVINPNEVTTVQKYNTDNGSLLPKSRYTDRRKVPQNN